MSSLVHDLRFALRLWTRAPLLATAAVLSLALGIGANVTVYTWLRQTVLDPLPNVPRSSELVALDTTDSVSRGGISFLNYQDLRRENTVLTDLCAGQQVPASLQDGLASQRVWVWYGTWNLFDIMQVKPALGRFFREEEDRPGQPVGVVLSDAYWRNHYAAAPGIVGRRIRLAGMPCEVLGVGPAGFLGPVGGITYDIFVPLQAFIHAGGVPEASLENRSARSLYLLGRLRPGIPLSQARTSLQATASALDVRYPATNRGILLNVYALKDSPMGAPSLLVKPLALLFVGVGFLLFIATANVANLLLARAAGREREMALRTAIGASRGRLVAQLLTESAVLGLAGGAGGILLSFWSLRLFLMAIPRNNLPVAFDLHLDPAAMAFAFVLSLAASMIFGILPALRGSGLSPAQALKEGSLRAVSGPRLRRIQALFAALEMAIAVALLVGAGLMVKSAFAIQRDSPGFDPRGVLFVNLGMDLGGYTAPEAAKLSRSLLSQVRGLPGVEAASFSEGLPLSLGGPKGVGGRLEGMDRPEGERLGFARNLVGPGFFRTFRIPLASGRDFTEDDRETTQPVVIVNQTLAGRYFPGRDPVGLRLRINGTWRTIVGVCRDFKFQNWSEPLTPFVFLPLDQWDVPSWNLVVRASGPGVAEALRKAVADLDPALPIQVMHMEHVAEAAGFLVRTSAVAMAGLGLAALFLASIGIYGVMAHGVSQRTPEIGIRMAMGARPGAILAMVLREAMAIALGGALLGLAGAYALGQRFADILHNTRPTDPAVFIGVPLLLLGVAALASILPALRAARIPPSEALRNE
jgi:predicted permease